MKLVELKIHNFRGLEEIEFKLNDHANVIVGPNAIGKTTILEAIRLAKALLAPRTITESMQVLQSLGAGSPHMPQQINLGALTRASSQPLQIHCIYRMSDTELTEINTRIPEIARRYVASGLGVNGNNPLLLTQFLSSPSGQQALQVATGAAQTYATGLASTKTLKLNLTMDTQGGIRGEDLQSQIIFSALESRLPARQALLGYFPADRAMPIGEVQIQLGAADATQQLESHNSQPQLKYQRFKTLIANTILEENASRDTLSKIFEDVFSNILPGKTLGRLGVNAFSAISIPIMDKDSGREFDLDQMSSGEKGLLLGALMIVRSTASGGIVLIDEPELHLNPSVCRRMFNFLIDKILVPNDVQAILCTHSAEILDEALDRENCFLFHLRSEKTISPINWGDRGEVLAALKRLGTSPSDELFFRGSIYVEGDHDLRLLRDYFEDIIYRYRITSRGGRGNIEAEIDALQKAEREGKLDGVHCFIFDLDRAPTDRGSTSKVKILQWDRYAIENYLIEPDIIYHLLRRDNVALTPIETLGDAARVLRDIALEQIKEISVWQTYDELNFADPGLRRKDIRDATFGDIANSVFRRLIDIREQIGILDEAAWKADFERRCENAVGKLRAEWDTSWVKQCNGKRFFEAIHSKFEVKMDLLKFKQSILSEMRYKNTENWKLLKACVQSLV